MSFIVENALKNNNLQKNPRCDYCLTKYYGLLRSYMLDEEIRILNANDLRALIERAELCDIVYDCLGGSEECLSCGGRSFTLDDELLVNFYHPFLSNDRLDVLKPLPRKKNYGDAGILCAKCGFVYKKRLLESK